jgi:hypothetical protein
MAAKKRSNSKGGHATSSEWRFTIVLSTAVRSVINMTTIAAVSGSVFLFLLTAKRFL